MIRKAVIVVLALGAVGLPVATFVRWDCALHFLGHYWYANNASLPHSRITGRPRIAITWVREPFLPVRPNRQFYYGSNRLLRVIRNTNRMAVSVSRTFTLGLAAVFAAYPTIAFIRSPLRRRRRRKRGECVACGYNLTDTVSGVCPECGTAMEHP